MTTEEDGWPTVVSPFLLLLLARGSDRAVKHAKLACFHILDPTFGLLLHSKKKKKKKKKIAT